MFRGGAGLILAHILYWFLHSCTDFLLSCVEEGLNQIYFISSVQQDLCKSPMPQQHSQSPAACAFSHRMLRKEKRKALGRAQLRKCHPLPHCTSVTSFSHTITGFSAFWASTATPSSGCFAATPNARMHLLKQTSAAVGGRAGVPAHSWLPFAFGQLTPHLCACSWLVNEECSPCLSFVEHLDINRWNVWFKLLDLVHLF